MSERCGKQWLSESSQDYVAFRASAKNDFRADLFLHSNGQTAILSLDAYDMDDVRAAYRTLDALHRAIDSITAELRTFEARLQAEATDAN